jgi:hypothetical protein
MKNGPALAIARPWRVRHNRSRHVSNQIARSLLQVPVERAYNACWPDGTAAAWMARA